MGIPADLYSSLNAHARAGRRWSRLGLHDQAATLLAQLLGVSLEQLGDPLWERCCLQRSEWFDERCRDFFRRHPTGMCIDLGAGLSTRFHRLSQSDDWPRFHWVDVDLPDIIAVKSAVMPDIDNYALVGANMLHDHWPAACGWKKDIPLILTLESVSGELKAKDISTLLKIIAKTCSGAASVEIAVDYSHHSSLLSRFLIEIVSIEFIVMRKITIEIIRSEVTKKKIIRAAVIKDGPNNLPVPGLL